MRAWLKMVLTLRSAISKTAHSVYPVIFFRLNTVNSLYSGHPRHHGLVSVIARVRNSGVRANFYFTDGDHMTEKKYAKAELMKYAKAELMKK